MNNTPKLPTWELYPYLNKKRGELGGHGQHCQFREEPIVAVIEAAVPSRGSRTVLYPPHLQQQNMHASAHALQS